MYSNNDSGHSSTTWILVANGSEAKLYTALNKDLYPTNLEHIELTLVEQFEHPQSREKDSDLVSDQPGRYANKGLPKSAFSEPTDPHDNERIKFAQELAVMLDEKRKTKGLDALILICPSRFYGDLNKHLSKHVAKVITKVIEKDYTKETQPKLIQHIKDTLSLQ